MLRRTLLDTAVAVFVTAIFWLPAAHAAGSPLSGVILAVATGAAVVLHRRRPGLATLVAAAATGLGAVLGLCRDPMLATAWCLFTLALARPVRHPLPLLVVLATGLGVVAAVPTGDPDGLGRQALLSVVALTVAWLLGTAIGRQVAAAREAERAQVHLALAREVHDVVGHALGVIGAEAGVTRALPDAGRDEMRDTLAEIESHARAALTEVQTLVRGLRAPARLDDLLSTARSAGLVLDARVRLSQPLGPAACRIVQESLSNVVRHAPGAACRVDVRDKSGWVEIAVRDDGPGFAGEAGFGLLGMRERAALAGGTVTWRNHPRGGFEVRARLPR
ncbi:sensor histidine kinase [Symbioplanes lichenis]|uniref:sensor histidine kinase n=1 Tax=Symbioplanes lichenis TaxID=1629072 RepID=UPI0027398BA8|nr:histidine kinase [Actinoplanes lichenis]